MQKPVFNRTWTNFCHYPDVESNKSRCLASMKDLVQASICLMYLSLGRPKKNIPEGYEAPDCTIFLPKSIQKLSSHSNLPFLNWTRMCYRIPFDDSFDSIIVIKCASLLSIPLLWHQFLCGDGKGLSVAWADEFLMKNLWIIVYRPKFNLDWVFSSILPLIDADWCCLPRI